MAWVTALAFLCSSSNILTSSLTMSLFPFGPTLENTLLFVLLSTARLVWVMPMMSLIHRLHSVSWATFYIYIIYIYIYVYRCLCIINISCSSHGFSWLCVSLSLSLSSFVSVDHHFWTTSCVCTELLLIISNWSSNTCTCI